MKILVTGSEGFIGKHVVRIAKERGHEVFKLDLKLQMDMMKMFPYQFASCDAVIHLASYIDITESFQKPWVYVENNLYSLKPLREAKRVVFASSAAVYGDFSPYGYTKRLGEELLPENSVSLRLFNPFGPGESHVHENHIIPVLANNSLRGETSMIFQNGEQIRDFIHVEDAAMAFVLATESNITGAYDLCDRPLQIKEVAKMMKVDYQLVNGGRDGGDTELLIGNGDPLEQALDWVPEHDVVEDIRNWRDWYETDITHSIITPHATDS